MDAIVGEGGKSSKEKGKLNTGLHIKIVDFKKLQITDLTCYWL